MYHIKFIQENRSELAKKMHNVKINNLKSTQEEVTRIVEFIQDYVNEGEKVVVPVSGGLDSDIVARLCCMSVGNDRVRLFIVVQDDMENKFLFNAKTLAHDLNVPLAEIHLEKANEYLMNELENGESDKSIFDTTKPLNYSKAKCSVRSSVISCYQDKGFLIAGSTNRSEKELGFFLTFGDNLANFKPIAHLYKSQLKEIALAVGTRQEVICQEPSAGFWEKQTDLEDLSYWIINDGPIVFPRDFSPEEVKKAESVKTIITQEKTDIVLYYFSMGENINFISEKSDLPVEIVSRIAHIVEKAKILKNREIMKEIKL